MGSDNRTRKLVVLVLSFVVVPSVLLITVGVLILVLSRASYDTVFGILILSITATVIFGLVAVVVFARRESNLAKLQTEFVAKVSHDLRTPLTSIRMFIDTLRLHRISDGQNLDDCLSVLSKETERLTSMINRLLQWGRMEAGKQVYSTELEEVRDVIEAAVAGFQPQLIEHPVILVQDIQEDLPRVRVDLAAMSEALLNLLQNAFRYTGEEKRITVRGRTLNGLVEICVEDNGPGIPEVERKRIFEKFYRSPEARMKEIEGSGLGLSMVRHIVQAHDGDVTLESDMGEGSTFIISLPPARTA